VCPYAAAAAGGEAPPTLTSVTFNLFHGGAFSGLGGSAHDLADRLEMAAEQLRALRADIIGLQEASRGRDRGDVAARLAARLGFHVAYAPANPRLFASDGFSRAVASLLNFEEGPAIVSRFPFVGWHAYELPRCGRIVESRRLLSATLATPWGPLRAFSAHTIGDPCQTRRVAEIVRGEGGPLPRVLMGDFNAVEDSPAIAALTRDVGFTDAFRTANPGQPGLTVWQRIEEATPTVRRRVDYIFVAPGAAVEGRVTSSRLVLNAPRRLGDGRTLWPSDHYGVAAEIEIFPLRAAAHDARRPGTTAGLPQSFVQFR
jgi:endonuclease/exonuclease/phosphatase family metal-dependent hydrolase